MSHFYRSKPPHVSQGDEAHCWAAALESWLACVIATFGAKAGEWKGIGGGLDGTAWKRRPRRKTQLLEDFKEQCGGDGALKPSTKEPYKAIALDFGMDVDFIDPATLTLDYLKGKLHDFSHLYMTYFSAVMRHAVVVYGISTTDGVAVMDPNPDVKFVHRPLSFFQTPERRKEWVTVGWAIKA